MTKLTDIRYLVSYTNNNPLFLLSYSQILICNELIVLLNEMGFFIELFQVQKEFTSLFEEMSLQQLEKCFYVYRQENVTATKL